MGKQEDIWYAVNITKVIHSPLQSLETFGTTTIRYHILSELMDEVNKVRLRAGSVYAERPQIITPSHFASQLLEGFGDKAREYSEWLKEHGEMIKILKYGLQFRKEKISEELLSGSINDVAKRVKDKIVDNNDEFSAIVIGADELWEVSLLKFFVDYIQDSASTNFREISGSQTESATEIRKEVEAEFFAASQDHKHIDNLGKKLQKHGLFEEFEDRFYGLLRQSGRC